MKGNKTWLIGIIFLFIFSTFSLAQSDIVISPIDKEITTAEEAIYEVKITNRKSTSRTYTLYGLDVIWSINPESKKFTLAGGQSKTTLVRIRPLGPFTPSTYNLKLYVDSSMSPTAAPSDRYKFDLPIVLYPENPIGYNPSIKVDIDMDEKINPQNPLSIKLFLENKNPLDLQEVKVSIQSDMPEFVKEVSVDLEPKERKTIEFSVTPDKFQQPKDYFLFFVFQHEGETIKVMQQKIEILPLLPDFIVESTEESVIFKRFTSLKVINEGNVLNTQKIKIPVSLFGSLFTKADSLVEDGQRYLVWEVALHPDESTNIDYVTNYRLLLYLLIILILFAIFYLTVKSPVKLHKKAHTVHTADGGALSEIKITLELRNLTNRKLEHVNIIDLVPGIANVEKSLHLGTLKPHEIRHMKRGAKVIWSLAELEPHEHRLITYNIKAKLNILGTICLPRAIVEYKKRRGKGKAYSNVFKLG